MLGFLMRSEARPIQHRPSLVKVAWAETSSSTDGVSSWRRCAQPLTRKKWLNFARIEPVPAPSITINNCRNTFMTTVLRRYASAERIESATC